jgi:hypothetical protein
MSYSEGISRGGKESIEDWMRTLTIKCTLSGLLDGISKSK